jgi:hypothetical protein
MYWEEGDLIIPPTNWAENNAAKHELRSSKNINPAHQKHLSPSPYPHPCPGLAIRAI